MLNTVQDIREDHGLLNLPAQKFIENRLFECEIELRRWITDEEYEKALETLQNENPDSLEPLVLRKAKAIKQAESALFMYFALQRLNVRVSDLGVVMSADSQNFGGAHFRIANPDEIHKIKKAYWKDALKHISGFFPSGMVLPTGA